MQLLEGQDWRYMSDSDYTDDADDADSNANANAASTPRAAPLMGVPAVVRGLTASMATTATAATAATAAMKTPPPTADLVVAWGQCKCSS
jgi:biotin carboxylase